MTLPKSQSAHATTGMPETDPAALFLQPCGHVRRTDVDPIATCFESGKTSAKTQQSLNIWALLGYPSNPGALS
ncbi:MAG: hypothetical protein AAGM22_31145 [Acidobacteriota bacterium]